MTDGSILEYMKPTRVSIRKLKTLQPLTVEVTCSYIEGGKKGNEMY